MPQESQVVGWPGRTLYDADGAKIGTIEDVFADERTGRPAWATVSSGLFGRKHHFVPIEQAREVHDGVAVPVAGQLVKDAPRVDQDGDLSREDERVLYRHYGLDDGEDDAAAAGTPERDRPADEHGRDDRATDDGPHESSHDDERRDDDLLRGGDDGTPIAYAHHDERSSAPERAHHDERSSAPERDAPAADEGRRERDGDDAGGGRADAPPAPAALQAEATTEARARAERERLAAAEAEHDRLTRAAPATPAGSDASDGHPHVLDRERAQEDLSVPPAPSGDDRSGRGDRGAGDHRGADGDRGGRGDRVPDAGDVLPQRDATGDPDPAPGDRNAGATDVAAPVPDARFVGRPHVDDDHHVRHDPIIDPTGGADDPADAGRGAGQGHDTGTHAGSAETARLGAGTRLRRLVRSITPGKDDHHG